MHNFSLATIGVCVFCASASVGAFFIFMAGINLRYDYEEESLNRQIILIKLKSKEMFLWYK